MRRKLLGVAFTLLALVCLTGASTISYNAGNPVPNPGGVANKLSADGTYTLDAKHKLSSIQLQAQDGFLGSVFPATTTATTWSTGVVSLNAGTYKCTAQLFVDDGAIWLADEKVVDNVQVK